MSIAAARVCAIVINWNGWRDTIVCVDSLLALDDAPGQIVVCDNGSADGSHAHLQAWLQGRGAADRARVHLVPLERNLGYAGGLNAGIAWAAQHLEGTQAWWLLNNDVQALPGALRALLAAHARVPGAGLCGSVLLDWDAPGEVTAVGGVYRRWLGVGWHRKDLPAGPQEFLLDIDYPVGASLLVDGDYLQRVGPMEDSYFLYYEEMDWVERGRRHGLRPVVALQSRLRHKEGASTGSPAGARNKSLLSERYGVINRLRITRKFWPAYLPLVWLSLWLVAADRIVHREFARAALVLRLMFSPRAWLA